MPFQAASAGYNHDQLCLVLQPVAGAHLDSGQDVLHPLREYDRLHGGDLVRTPRVYLTCRLFTHYPIAVQFGSWIPVP